ncbi:hypothetical protein ABZY03_30555 [Streptomyces klenkii]|uniref:hypothetical protein n=1 Tax=Streptomyces klenkii TaxID=1420899 RepID=UPI0033B602D1
MDLTCRPQVKTQGPVSPRRLAAATARGEGSRKEERREREARKTKKEEGKKEEERKKEKKEKEEEKAPKQKTLLKPLSVTTRSGSKEAKYTVPKGYEFRLNEVSVTATGPTTGTWQLTAHQGRFANGALGKQYQHTWKDTPYVVPSGKTVSLAVTCTKPPTGSGTPKPTGSGIPAPTASAEAAPDTCTATAMLNGLLVPTKGPFSSPPPHKAA